MGTLETSPKFHLSQVEAKTLEILSKKQTRIELDDFSDIYDKTMISDDEQEVRRLDLDFEKNDTAEQKELKKLADLMQMLFSELVELEDWLGDDVFILNTSKYDDYKNGVDLVVEFLRNGAFSHLGLAVDVTFGKSIEGKVARIKREIEAGQMPEVKYFISEGGDFRGELTNIPRIIIGADRKTIDRLAELWLNLMHLRSRKQGLAGSKNSALNEQLAETKNKLQNHPLQVEILLQVTEQLERYAEYSARVGRPSLTDKYRSVLKIVESILRGKEQVAKSPDYATFDKHMSQEIYRTLNMLMPSPPTN